MFQLLLNVGNKQNNCSQLQKCQYQLLNFFFIFSFYFSLLYFFHLLKKLCSLNTREILTFSLCPTYQPRGLTYLIPLNKILTNFLKVFNFLF